jgi:group I intron endonuclease
MLIYCILFPNGKRYVGKTECSLAKRQKEHRHHSKNGTTRLYNAIRKYGWGNLDWITLEECKNATILSEREVVWIDKFSCLEREKGYNLREGGEGGRHSEETKKKISKANLGENNGMYGKPSWNSGKKLSKSHREALSKSHKGQDPWNKGRRGEYSTGPRSRECKEKISKANSGENNGQAKMTWEVVRAIREEHKTTKTTQKKLAKKYNVSPYMVWSIVNNKRWRKND